jgi:hypothetical protein
MFFSLLAISASGQKQKTFEQVILQDDKSGDHLIFVISSGEYKFESCTEKFATSGIGTVTITGCTVLLTDISESRRVLAEVDLCAKAGKAEVAFRDDASDNESAFEAVVSDSDTSSSGFTCESNRIAPK